MIISNMFEEMSHMISCRVVFISKGRDYTYLNSKFNKLIFIFEGSIYMAMYIEYIWQCHFYPSMPLEYTMFIFVAYPAHQFRVYHIWFSVI